MLNTAINLALAGNETMLRLFLERMLPAKPSHEPISIEFTADKKQDDYLEACGHELIQAVSEGKVAPSDALPLFRALDVQCKLIVQGTMSKDLKKIQEAVNIGGY